MIVSLNLYILKFIAIFSIKEENVIGNLIALALSLQFALGSTVIQTILILLIQEHSITFHLFVLSSISFINILQFMEHRLMDFLGSFILKNFIILDFLIFSFWAFFVSLQKCNRFLCINFVSCNFTKFIDELQQFSDSIFSIFYVQYHSSTVTVLHFFQLEFFIYFSYYNYKNYI